MRMRDLIQKFGIKVKEPKGSDDILLPGTISPQLQTDSNCIAAAIANAIWYWGNNGLYRELIAGRSFGDIKSIIHNYMEEYGGFANNNIPRAVEYYLENTTDRLLAYTEVWWNPDFSLVVNSIAAGKPCLVGFAAGSPYSNFVGHMTCCMGFHSGTTLAADGHTEQLVRQRWGDYNDCVITIDFV